MKGEESASFIIGQGARGLSSAILRQSGVKYRGIPPPLHFVTFRDAQVFLTGLATPTSTKSLWPSSVLWLRKLATNT